MRISDWSSDVCSSDLSRRPRRLAVNIECPHMSRGRERGFATRLRIRAARPAERTDEKAMAEEQMNFQAEVSRLLDIVAHSPYSEKIGRAHVCTPVSNAQLVCHLLVAEQHRQQLTNTLLQYRTLHVNKQQIQ